MSLMTEAFHAIVMSSAIVMGGRDRVDFPAEADDWIHPSHTSEDKEDLRLLKIAQGPRNRLHCLQPGRGVALKVFQLRHHG